MLFYLERLDVFKQKSFLDIAAFAERERTKMLERCVKYP
jgi:hypothetical protein